MNVHLAVPVFSRPGRGIPFSYTLAYDSSIWTPTVVSGSQTWVPANNWGWVGQTQVQTGYVAYRTISTRCWDGDSFMNYTSYQLIGFIDRNNISHPFNIVVRVTNCGTDFNQTTTTTDGSGYTINVSQPWSNVDSSLPPTATVAARDGIIITPGLSASGVGGMVQDANGNQVSTNGSGVFTDTLGQTALTITGSGTSLSPFNYNYTDTLGTQQSVTVNYGSFTVQTVFGCSGVGEYNQPNIPLVSTISYPDGTFYGFQYEPTNGGNPVPYPLGNTNDNRATTGRIAQITLPTGGTIAYTYFNGNNGIVCADGSTAAMHRTTTDGDTVYGRTPNSSTSWTTTITPPDSNETDINFQTFGSNFYETTRTNYVGPKSANPQVVASSSTTCYNGAPFNSCDAAITANITEVTSYPKTANNYVSKTDSFYNGNGLNTAVYEYDFGSGAAGALLRQTITTYNTSLGSILDHPYQTTVYDGANNQVAQTTFGYDETPLTTNPTMPMHTSISGSRGNLTTVNRWRNLPTAATLTTTNWYDDAGNLTKTQDPGGHTTTLSYVDNWRGTSCVPTNGYAFLTLVTDALAHTSSAQYYPCTGQVYSAGDQNGNVTTTTYDPMLRPLKTTRPDGGHTDYTYSSYGGNLYSQAQDYMDSTNNVNHWVLLDGYGRTSRSFMVNAEGSDDQQDTCYDNMGQVKFVSYPYQGSGLSSPKICTGNGDSYTYSFAGTPSNIARVATTHADGTTFDHDVYGRSILDTDEGTGTGTTRIQRMSQVDGLGRTVSVCEVSSTTQSGSDNLPLACGLDMPGGYNGFMTTYGYDTLDNLTSVAQGTIAPHTRTFAYDSLSRLLSSSAPESGATSYTYDNDGNILTRVRPAANQTGSATVTTTYAYDALHRLTQTSYSDSTYPVFNYYDESSWAGATFTNTIGRLSHTVVNSSTYAFNAFTYDSMGRVLGNWQDTPVFGGYSKGLSYTYDYLGNVLTATDGANDTFTDTYNQASRLTSLSSSWVNATHPATLISGIHYGPFGPSTAALGNGLTQNFGYTARGLFQSNSIPGAYSVSTNHAPNGNVSTANDSVNGNWNYAYDDFNRLSGATKGTSVYNYLYDRFGNRWQTQLNSVTQQNLSFDSTNRIASGNGISYDAAGNVISDSISDPGHTHTYTYDAENRVISIDSGAWTYAYDSFGRRVQKSSIAGAHYDSLYDLAGHAITLYSNGAYAGSEIYAGSMHLATYTNNHTIFHATDWLGSERLNTDETGTPQETCTALPFGDGSSCTGPGYAANLFTDDPHDSESNTEHTLFRQMSGTQGRWLSPDPYMGSMDVTNPQSMNRYAYVTNDPIDFTDIFGLNDDCHGPCVPFSYVSGNCSVQVTYQKVKANGDIYDMPTITTVCGIGGGGNRGGTILAGWRCPRCFRSVMPQSITTKPEPRPDEACGGTSIAVNVGASATGVLGLNAGLTLGISLQGITSSYGIDGSAGSLQASAGGGVSIQDLHATNATAEWAIMPPPVEKASVTIPTNGQTGLQGIGLNVGVGVAWPPGAAVMYHNNTNYKSSCLSWAAIGDIAGGIWNVLTGH